MGGCVWGCQVLEGEWAGNQPQVPKVKGFELLGGPQMIQLR